MKILTMVQAFFEVAFLPKEERTQNARDRSIIQELKELTGESWDKGYYGEGPSVFFRMTVGNYKIAEAMAEYLNKNVIKEDAPDYKSPFSAVAVEERTVAPAYLRVYKSSFSSIDPQKLEQFFVSRSVPHNININVNRAHKIA